MKKRVTAISIVILATMLTAFILLGQRSNSIQIHFVQAPLQNNTFYTYQAAYRELHDKNLIYKISYSHRILSLVPQSIFEHIVHDNKNCIKIIQTGISEPYVEAPVIPSNPNMKYLMEWREMINLIHIEQEYYSQKHNYFKAAKLGLDAEQFSVEIPNNGPLISDLVSVAFIPKSCRTVAAELPYLNRKQLQYCIERQNEIIRLHVPFYKILETERDTQTAQLKFDIKKQNFTTVMHNYANSNFHVGLANAAFDMRYIMTSGDNIVQDDWTAFNLEIAINRPGTPINIINNDQIQLKKLANIDPVNNSENNLLTNVKIKHDYGRNYITSLLSTMQDELAEKSKSPSSASHHSV